MGKGELKINEAINKILIICRLVLSVNVALLLLVCNGMKNLHMSVDNICKYKIA